MSENNARPIYIKKQNRKRNRPSSDQQRLHGAFTGGFSAGHFNTVGSKDGWKPSYAADNDIENEEEIDESNNPFFSSSSIKKKLKRKNNYEQKLEDYMDEEDANEWGGPIKVKETYQTKSNNNIIGNNDERYAHKSLITDSSSLRNLLYQKKNKNDSTSTYYDSIGKQLLKVLGWRENRRSNDNDNIITSYAYVPIDDDEKPQRESLLSSKKLKRIEIQLSSQHNSNYIPPPKIDTYGMGFEPYKNAPEFKAHRELRKRRAEDRARAASNSKGENRMNVYNMSVLNDFDDGGDDDGGSGSNNGPRTQKTGHDQHNTRSGSNVLAYETMEDFIGNTTSAGFALHDDDDQVYDKNSGHSASLFNKGERGKIEMSEYHNEVYEGSDSEVEDSTLHEHDDGIVKSNKQNSAKLNTQHSTLQSFAGALSNWASDGNTKASSQGEQRNKAITSDGEAPLHGFELGGGNSETMKRYPGPDVPHNFVPKPHEFSNQDAISNMKALTSIMKDNMKPTKSDSVINNRQKEGPMASKAFASLSTALKSRFTTSTSKQGETKPKNEKTADPKRIKVTRSTISWKPTNLLLKRFKIDRSSYFNTQSNKPTQDNSNQQVLRTREEDFFERDILSHLDNAKKLNHDSSSSSLNQHQLSAETINVERPSLDLMKSIFEPSSDEDEDYSNSELVQFDLETKSQHQSESVCHSDEQYNNKNITSLLEVENHNDIASDSSSSSVKRHKKRKKSSSNDRKRKKHKSKRKK